MIILNLIHIIQINYYYLQNIILVNQNKNTVISKNLKKKNLIQNINYNQNLKKKSLKKLILIMRNPKRNLKKRNLNMKKTSLILIK